MLMFVCGCMLLITLYAVQPNMVPVPLSSPPTYNPPTYNSPSLQYQTMLSKCGLLCDTSVQQTPGKFFKQREVATNCDSLFGETLFPSTGHGQPNAPKEIPHDMLQGYTLNGAIQTKKWYFDQTYHGGEAKQSVWTLDMIETQKQQCLKGSLKGTYSIHETSALLDGLRHAPKLTGGRVLVIGMHTVCFPCIKMLPHTHSILNMTPGFNVNHVKFVFIDCKSL